jgi:hypothetical protein
METQTAEEMRQLILSRLDDLQHNEISTRRNKVVNFNDVEELKKAGFLGFKAISELWADNSPIPPVRGVYLVLYLDKSSPKFVVKGTGGFFKGKDPNVSLEELKANWVDGTNVIYVGKAGGENSGAKLYSRLNQYLQFGKGKSIGHYGGRYIWQIANSMDLVVCWKPVLQAEPRDIEAELIKSFVAKYGKRPFANLKD